LAGRVSDFEGCVPGAGAPQEAQNILPSPISLPHFVQNILTKLLSNMKNSLSYHYLSLFAFVILPLNLKFVNSCAVIYSFHYTAFIIINFFFVIFC
jgi:hypothetical protein